MYLFIKMEFKKKLTSALQLTYEKWQSCFWELGAGNCSKVRSKKALLLPTEVLLITIPVQQYLRLRQLSLNPICIFTHRLVVISHLAGMRPKRGPSTLEHQGSYVGFHSQPTHRKCPRPSDFCGDESMYVCGGFSPTTGRCPAVGWITHQPFLTPLTHLH